MKNILASSAILVVLSAPVLAGEFELVTPSVATVAPVASQGPTWGGIYGGITGSFVTDGTSQYIYDDVPLDFYDLVGTQYGGFAGYNFQQNSFVYGGELAILLGSVHLDGAPDYVSDMTVDLKARAGYALGSALVYGFVGGSMETWDNNGMPSNPNALGINYGAGVDFLLTEKLFLGVEYIMRDVSTDFDEANDSVDLTTSAVQVRAGMKF